MASKEVYIKESLILSELIETPVVLSRLKPDFINEFLEPFESYLPEDLHKIFRLPVQIRENSNGKFNPFLRLAQPEDAPIITDIVQEIYEGTYPYKEMEDPNEIARLINSGTYKFIVFLNNDLEVIGSTCFVLNRRKKKGYLRSLVIRKKWCGKLDTKKAYITACLMVWNKYRDHILFWWAETRTANAKTQSITRQCGLRPIAFFPNKDIFYNKIESDLLIIAYNSALFKIHRSNKIPEFIPAVKNCFDFTSREYGIEKYKISDPDLELNSEELKRLRTQVKIEKRQDEFGYVTVTLRFPQSSSYFTFLYTPSVENFEKTKFKVKTLEELYVFTEQFITLALRYSIRYLEIYLSAYNPYFQKIFFLFGLVPRGYIPGFCLNKKIKKYEDRILFNSYQISNDDQVLPELIPVAKRLINHVGR